jgi:site-specific DNA recombinase
VWLGYSRVSRVGGRSETLISPDVQRKRIAGFCEMRGFEVEMLPPELDVSGGKVSRPILDQAIARIESGEAEGVIVAQLDRLSRMALTDALETIHRIEGAGGQVIAVAENIDATTPEGRMARNMFLSMAEMQRERYAEHIATSKRQAVERGIWAMSVVPRGYAKGRDRRLVPDSRVAPLVRRAFEKRAGGAPWTEVADVLGCGHSGAGKVIRNRVYLGEIRLTIDGEEVVNPRAHEPLVSRDLWEAAQIAHPAPSRGENEPALLAGLIRCAACYRQMSPGDGVYRCFPRKVAGNCTSPTQITRRIVEEHVEELVLAELRRAEGVRGRSLVSADAEREALEDAERELEAWREVVKIADVGPEFVAAELKRHVEAVEQARRALGRAQAVTGVVAEARSVAEVFESLSVVAKRHVLRRAIGVVWVRKARQDRIKVVRTGFEPDNLSGPGRSAPPVRVEWAELPGEVGLVEGEGFENASG